MSVSREATRAVVCTVAVEARVDLQVAVLAAGADAAAPSQARIVVAHWGCQCSMVQHQAGTSRSWETYLKMVASG